VDPQLEGRVDKDHLALNCTPVVNLFSKELDPVGVDNRFHEFHVVPDRQRPLDFELFQIETLTGHGRSGATEFMPFYFASDRHPKQTSYFTVYRTPRPLTLDETADGMESPYVGSEVYVSLLDTEHPPFPAEIRELHVRALCTNRHWPDSLALSGDLSDFTAGGGLPCTGIRCLSGPTRPSCSCVEGKLAWRVISHLSFNHLPLARGSQMGVTNDAAALRELLQVYADMGGAEASIEMAQRIVALRTVTCQPVIERLQSAVDPLALIRGLEIKLGFSESISGGVFLLAAVLERFLARAVSINSFVKTIASSDQRPVIMEWIPRIGTRESL
jgi:type VI secretion system protein ImpG